MERRGREGMWEKGDGTCCTSKWLCFPECAAQSLVTRLTKLEGFLSLSEAQPEWALFFLLLKSKVDRNYIKIKLCIHTYKCKYREGRGGVLGLKKKERNINRSTLYEI